mmetsp:Transcript_81559/g.147297  ORF Transcript_81559/g.147297 Transcript_81559/m.147297 type:complete len:332 (-) Transcript_81559:163-1158(-)
MAPLEGSEVTLDTFIFVDVDGVLNCGVRDDRGAPILLMEENIEMARKLTRVNYTGVDSKCVETIQEVANRQIGHGEQEEVTYETLATEGRSFDLSEVLVSRLAKLIDAAGSRTQVILSSSWRQPRQRPRRMRLEERLSAHLKRVFQFDSTTPLDAEESCPADRLRVVGDYLGDICTARGPQAPPLRVLVLEDFFVNPLNGWKCGGAVIDSVAAAEQYLHSIAQPKSSQRLEVKLVHTYEEWLSPTGAHIQIGCGLLEQPCIEAFDFLTAPARAPHVGPRTASEIAMVAACFHLGKERFAEARKAPSWSQRVTDLLPMIRPSRHTMWKVVSL